MAKKWVALLLAAAVAAAVLWTWQSQRRARRVFESRMAELEHENRGLRARLAGPPPTAPAAAAPAAPAPGKEGRPAGPGTGQYIEAVRAMGALQQQLDAAKTHLESVSTREQQLEAQMEKLTADNKRLSASEEDLNANLSSANNLVVALQKELKTKSDRLVEIEIEAQKVKDRGRADQQRIQDIAKLSAQLEELYRRRDTYLNNVLRRYKDVTEQYRSLAGMMENRGADTPGITAADLSRIQNSIALAEEDMRQINSLNAQAVRLEKKISGK